MVYSNQNHATLEQQKNRIPSFPPRALTGYLDTRKSPNTVICGGFHCHYGSAFSDIKIHSYNY